MRTFSLNYDYSKACLISQSDSFLLVGSESGLDRRRIERYSPEGNFIETLPHSETDSLDTACGSFEDSEGQTVLLITSDDGGTELLLPNANTWAQGKITKMKQVADEEVRFKVLSGPELPRKLSGTRIASLPNTLLLTGGSSGDLGKEVGTKDVSKQKQKSNG